MNLTLADTLQEQRRKSLLTGKPLTPQEISGMTSGYFGTQARLSNQNWAQRLREEELKDQKARELEMMKAGKEQSKMTGISNIAENAITKLGTNYLTSKPGESMIAKGANLAKTGIDKIGGWFGGGAPTFTTALQAPAGEVGASMLGGADMAAATEGLLPSLGGEVATSVAAPVAEAGSGITAGLGEAIGGAASWLGNAANTVSSYSPYLLLATAASEGLKAIGGGNQSNTATQLGKSLEMRNWFGRHGGIGGSILNQMTSMHDEDGSLNSTGQTIRTIMDIFNPVAPILGAVEDAIGSWLCTATRNVVGLGQSEAETMKALKRYANEKHKGWLTFYLKYGTILTRIIAEQEEDLKGFYENLRRTLIEPVCKVFRADPEAAFGIYHFIGKTLFRAYMPELEVKEIDDER